MYRKPIDCDWPADELEFLGVCPVCGCARRSVAFEGLRDKTFFCAPGEWKSWSCESCHVVYLDPRPSQLSIVNAYKNYYTHKVEESSKRKEKLTNRLVRLARLILKYSYLNHKFGYAFRLSVPFGWLAMACMPLKARHLGRRIRHLPRPRSQLDCVLDIGCGNGEFLQIARDELGYAVEGLEPDQLACDVARARGIRIHVGLIPGSGLQECRYEHITLNHVLEHLHNPKEALQEILKLLKPGGRLWVSIPNASAKSITRFGANSRLLEPPRHLVMFDTKSLYAVMAEVGFQDICWPGKPDFEYHDGIFAQSWMIDQSLDPGATSYSLVPDEIKLASVLAYRDPKGLDESAEIITMVGVKPT